MRDLTKGWVSVELLRTGDPWIDCGIVALSQAIGLHRIKVNKIRVTWDGPDKLMISGGSYKEIEDFLKEILEQVKSNRYVEQTRNKVCFFNKERKKFKVVPKINLVGVVGFLFSGGDLKVKYEKKPLTDKLRKELKEFKKLYGTRKEIDFRVDEKNRLYASAPRYNWPYKPKLEGRTSTCSFCQRMLPCADVHSNNYPFAVAVEHFRNFFSNLRSEPKICSLCELASLLAVNCVFFNLSDRRRRLFLAIPHAQSLDELQTFWDEMRGIKAIEPLRQDSNILDGGYRYRHLSENILAFVLELYLKLSRVKKRDKLLAEKRDKLLAEASSKTWHFYLASRNGKTISFDGYDHLTDLQPLFSLFSVLKDPEEFKQTFQQLAIKQGDQWRTELRNQMAKRIIKNAPLNVIAERIVWKRGYVKGLNDFVEQYNMRRG